MKFDPQIVAQAKAFVNNLHAGNPVCVPRMPFSHWHQFIATVRIEQAHEMVTQRPAWQAFLSTVSTTMTH